MKLNYKASSIARAEQEYGLKLFSVMESLSDKQGSVRNVGVIDMLFLWVAGGGTPEEFDEIAETDVEKLMLIIMDGLNQSGFLGMKGKLDLDKAKEELNKLKAENK